MTTVEELEEQIFKTITSLRNSKKQPNEDTIYCIISKTKTTKSLNNETLQEALNELVNSKKLKVKLHNGSQSINKSICFKERFKLYNLQIYINIFYFTRYAYDNRDNEN